MKKFLTVLLIAAMAVTSFGGCAKGGDSSKATSENNTGAAASDESGRFLTARTVWSLCRSYCAAFCC